MCFIHRNVPLASAVVITPEQELQILKWIGYESFLFETSGRNVVAQWQSCLLCMWKSWVQSLAAPPGWLEETIASQLWRVEALKNATVRVLVGALDFRPA